MMPIIVIVTSNSTNVKPRRRDARICRPSMKSSPPMLDRLFFISSPPSRGILGRCEASTHAMAGTAGPTRDNMLAHQFGMASPRLLLPLKLLTLSFSELGFTVVS